MNRHQWIEEMNYQNDYRTRAAQKGSAWKGYDENHGVLSVDVYIDDEYVCDLETSVDFPACLAVCPTCKGSGTYVNPAIDASGITRDQFDEDPYFEESYRAGHYDVTCATCRGNRVIPVIDENSSMMDDTVTISLTDEDGEETGSSRDYSFKQLLKLVHEMEADQIAHEAERRAERMMGA